MEDNLKTRKHPLLSDGEWLRQKYVEECFSTSEIAKQIGCSKDGVRVALLRFNLKLRSAGQTNRIKSKRNGFRSKYKELNDKEWLREKYIEEGFSLQDIAEFVGAKNHNSVRQAALFHGIEVRNISDGLTFNREDDFFFIEESIVTGCLLGDAGLRCWNKSSDKSYPSFYKRNIHYDHVMYVASRIFSENPENRVKMREEKLNEKIHSVFELRSLTHRELLPYWKRWYPSENNFSKVVPRDIVIDEIALLHWFLDDGSSSFRNRNHPKGWQQRKRQVRLTFSSESFSKNDQEFLCDQLNDRFSLKAKTASCNSGTGFRIQIPQSKANYFFDLIGPCPDEIPSMAYKWKIPTF